MASKLDKMIAPDERVVYRTRYGFRDALTNLLLISAWIGVIWVAVKLPVGFEPWDTYFLLSLISGFGAFETWRAFTKTSVVTDRRFLYKAGFINPKVHDIALSKIEGVACYPNVLWFRQGTIRVRAGEIITRRLVPDAENTCRAIRTEAGLPQPPALARKVIVWAWLNCVFVIAVTLSFMVGILYQVTLAYVWPVPDAPLLEVLQLFVLLSSMIGGGLIGGIVSTALSLTVTRIFLSANEASQLIYLAYAFQSGIKGLGSLTRGHVWFAERFLSLLYGQPIRCADSE